MILVDLISQVPLEVPNPGSGTAPPGSGQFIKVMGWAKWLSLGILVVALIFAGARMGLRNRSGDGGEHGAAIGWTLGGVIVVSSAFALVTQLAT